jgi:hypothetical protein
MQTSCIVVLLQVAGWGALLLPSLCTASPLLEVDPSIIDNNDNQPWFSLTPNLEFQLGEATNPDNADRLGQAQRRFLSSAGSAMKSPYLDGSERYYEDYSQAWRMLGFYIDCTSADEADDRRRLDTRRRRRLDDDDDNDCQRYILWAAYVDLNHEGDGLYEYIMWDPHNNRWNTDGCRYDPDSIEDDEVLQEYEEKYRCVKLDCHVPSTHFELLGLFKEPGHEDWFEQLFKHEGNCVWTEDEYDFMQTYRETWPDGCTQTATEADDDDGNSNFLYYDVKPMSSGLMDIGLYTDEACSQDYTGNLRRENVLAGYLYGNPDYNGDGDDGGNNNNNNGYYDLLDDDNIDKWNSLLSLYTICQPCVAYTPAWMGAYTNGNNGGRRADSDDDEDFGCEDDAGYENVNQCMKFATHTDMAVAYDFDIVTAASQGTLTSVPLQVTAAGKNSNHGTKRFPASFWWAFVYFSGSCLLYAKALQVRRRVRRERTMKEPLVKMTRRKSSRKGEPEGYMA